MNQLSNRSFRVWAVLFSLLGMSAASALVARGNDDLGDAAPHPRTQTSTAGAWNMTGPMEYDRYWLTATTLQNGQMLVTGGYNGESYDLDESELYDGTTGLWTDR
jgi:hypothetical protein